MSWLLMKCLITNSFEPRFLGTMWSSVEPRHPREKLFLGSSMCTISSSSCLLLRVLSPSLHFSNKLPNPGHFPHGEVIKSVTLVMVGGGSFSLK